MLQLPMPLPATCATALSWYTTRTGKEQAEVQPANLLLMDLFVFHGQGSSKQPLPRPTTEK